MIEILNFYELILSDINIISLIFKQLEESFNEKQVKDISYIINEIETKSERLPERFISSYLKFMQNLIFKNILNHEKQVKYVYFLLAFI
jgi:hypothetical protein